MRVIAGTLGGRLFDSPHGHRTHPMSDKVRGALFNILGDLDDLHVLDAFAGSGALSFEAISRGATSAIAIESDRQAQQTIAENIRALQLGNSIKLIKASANAWLQTNPDATFDIVLCDPPYDDLQPTLLAKLAQRIAPTGILALSWPGAIDLPAFDGLTQVEQRSYGDAQLVFFHRIS
ncbi:MAG TPA: 16S rRNA (guanine(966)-N(2))-methyltransferase RsmD [Nevskiaceae bacterium]|nr:16S rRNA (guanine(966)-N(2))-methyltransferase RsmD [Nevskiaceae bacterium]